jgi:hypothetical protein
MQVKLRSASGVNMPHMGSAMHTIPILSTSATPGCGACLQSAGSGPVCRAVLGEPCEAPVLVGPADELQRLMTALAPVLGALESSGLVRALHVQPGEVELQLAVRAGCGGAALADSAFQTLRSLLPDTDIYVVPAP